MKKSLLLSAAAVATLSMAMQAKTTVWDFNTHGIFADFQNPESSKYFTGNYDFIDTYCATKNTDGEVMVEATKITPEDGSAAYYVQYGKNNRLISLYDGLTYSFTADETCKNGTLENPYFYEEGEEIAPGQFGPDTYEPRSEEYKAALNSHPYISWAQREEGQESMGPSRVIWMTGWGSLEAWEDKNYDAVDTDNWVATKHALSFGRCGVGKGSMTDTYIQFPAVQAPLKATYYILVAKGKKDSYSNELRCKVEPVVNGQVVADKAVTINEPVGTTPETIKQYRYYKYTYNYDGNDMVSLRIGNNGRELQIMHVEIESADGTETGIADIIANPVNENAPIYNVMGVQVDENYKGVVIKNGKKYIQR